MTDYICMGCLTRWPCGLVAHQHNWSLRAAMPAGSELSIACFVFDHEQCTVALFCKCSCHNHSMLEEPSISVPPSNR